LSVPSWFRNGFYGGVAFTLLISLFLAWVWQPQRQVSRHTANLFLKIERKNWAGIADFLADDYTDQWGDDRALVLERMRESLAYVRTMRIIALNPVLNVDSRRGVWRARITIDGEGGELLDLIKERINPLATPFELEWHQVSGKPWDWKLATVHNRDLEIPAEF
jgi:hypothetical protein